MEVLSLEREEVAESNKCRECNHEREFHFTDKQGYNGCKKCHCLGFLEKWLYYVHQSSAKLDS